MLHYYQRDSLAAIAAGPAQVETFLPLRTSRARHVLPALTYWDEVHGTYAECGSRRTLIHASLMLALAEGQPDPDSQLLDRAETVFRTRVHREMGKPTASQMLRDYRMMVLLQSLTPELWADSFPFKINVRSTENRVPPTPLGSISPYVHKGISPTLRRSGYAPDVQTIPSTDTRLARSLTLMKARMDNPSGHTCLNSAVQSHTADKMLQGIERLIRGAAGMTRSSGGPQHQPDLVLDKALSLLDETDAKWPFLHVLYKDTP